MTRRLGFGLVTLSVLLYAGLLLVPFVSLEAGGKIGLSAILVIVGEISFWAGCALLGRELVVKYRRWLDPRRLFSRRREGDSSN